MHYILYGFKNAGKTTIGKKLSQKLQLDFIDIDEAIEQKYKRFNSTYMSFYDIFNTYGEKVFRQLERCVVRDICKTKKSIIATGGSTLLSSYNKKMLKLCGHFIYLDVAKKVLLERFMARPLSYIKGKNLKHKFFCLYDQRHNHYQMISDVVIEMQSSDIAENMDLVLKQLERYG